VTEAQPPDISKTLRAANLALVQHRDVDTVLETLLDYLQLLVPSDSASVILLEDGLLVVRAGHGYERYTDAATTRKLRFDPQTHPHMLRLLQERHTQVLADTWKDPGWDRSVSPHIRSWMGVPLVDGGTVIGLFSVDKVEPGYFGPRHRELGEALTASATIAIQNARLTARLQGTIAMLEEREAERHRTEQVLRESEERFSRAFGASPAALSISALADGRYLYVNDAFLRLVGHAREEVVGRTSVDIAFWSDADDRAQAISLLKEHGSLRELETSVRTRTGERRDILLSLELLAMGGETCLLGFCQDITARKRAEQAVRERDADQQVILDSVNAMIWYKDKHNRVIRANRAAAATLGLKPADVEGRSTYDLYPAEAARFYEDDLDVMLSGRPKLGITETLRNQKGQVRFVQTDKIPYRDDQGNIIGVIVFSFDVTERHELEEQLRQVQKMEAAGRLAGGLAHDFNNLLTAILGYGDLLLARLPEGDPLRRHSEEIRRAGERASALTRQLLAFSRKQVLLSEVVDPNALIGEIATMMRRLAGERIEVDLSLASTAHVLFDPGQLEQVVVNLVLNARDAMPQGGLLGLSTRDVVLDADYVHAHIESALGPHVLLEVRDTGTGMDAETRSHIFEPFFTTKEVGKGTGLGLSTVYGIVKQSGGHIVVKSEAGRGSTFRLYLPATDARAHAADSTDRLQLRGTETILVAEDEAMVRELTREILEEAGYTVIEAADGGEALRLAAAHVGPIHLLLSDVVMPGMMGAETAARLRTLRPEVKILYMSGHTDDPAIESGKVQGDAPLLAKPFSPAALTSRVREALGRRYETRIP
jgi:two-component system, cell cycle sensor histidine kinase and response regulator CckA